MSSLTKIKYLRHNQNNHMAPLFIIKLLI